MKFVKRDTKVTRPEEPRTIARTGIQHRATAFATRLDRVAARASMIVASANETWKGPRVTGVDRPRSDYPRKTLTVAVNVIAAV